MPRSDFESALSATIYRFVDGSVGYLAPHAPNWYEADELEGDDLAEVRQILDLRREPVGKSHQMH